MGIPEELDPDRPVFIACGSGRRSVIAATLLARHGYRPVVVTGGGVAEVVEAQKA